jgi:predicted NACHT family NTPase
MSQEQKQPQTSTRLTELNQDKHRDFTPEQKEEIIAKGNPKIDNNVIKGYN